MDGADGEDRGSEDAPWANLQYAVDRALPGDRIVVHEGIYLGKVVLTHGGTKDAPISIVSPKRGEAILDGMKDRADWALLRLEGAPYVVIDGFEVRWFAGSGIYVDRSAGVVIRNCDFWNAHITKGRWSGLGVFSRRSPNIHVHGNTFYSCNRMYNCVQCDGVTVTHNTVARMLHGTLTVAYSAGATVENNSFTYGGSYALTPVMTKEQFESFRSDYNNFAMFIPEHRWTEGILPKEKIERVRYGSASKALANLFIRNGHTGNAQGLARWQELTGLDQHSIWVEPMYVDPKKRDFRLQPGSPNIGAGRDGATIGAMGVAGE
jgi:hypothetical protein